MDFGYMDPNKGTTLTEVNDFWAIGNYTLSHSDYAEMLAARWAEVVNTATVNP